MSEHTIDQTTENPCDCGDPRRGRLSRRGFLGAAGALGAGAALAAVGPGFGRAAFAGTTTPAGDTLVVVDLRGGMDGLSMVAPVGDPAYATLRPTLAIPASSGLATGDRMFALHPALAPLKPLWDAKTFGAVHAVAQPDASRSHFESQYELDRAAPGTAILTGWLDRAILALGTTGALQAATLGDGIADRVFAGPSPVFAAESLAGYTLYGSDQSTFTPALQAMWTGSAMPWAGVAAPTLQSVGTAAAVSAAQANPANGAVYPDGELGASLQDVARLIRAGVGLRFASVNLGNWDMHVSLGAHGTGWMADQAGQLANALAAFVRDIGPAAYARTTILTISEFGRRAGENGSGGVDHGHGNAVLFLGGSLAGGAVKGRWPTLADSALDQGDLAGTSDFRDVFAEVLTKRCGLPTSALSSVFPGYAPAAVGLTR